MLNHVWSNKNQKSQVALKYFIHKRLPEAAKPVGAFDLTLIYTLND